MGNTLDYLLRLQDRFTGPLKQSRDEVGRFTSATKQLGATSSNVNSLAGSFVGLATKIGACFTAYKALEVGLGGFKHALSVSSAMETTQASFKTMLGSASSMLETLGSIKKLAAETPFEFPELANAGRMLLAFGEQAKDIPDTLRRIGDVSSAVAAPIGEIAEIYGKARTQGTLFSEDINQLTGRGIPIIREFAKILGQPESAIKKLAEEGKLTFPLLDQAFRNLTGAGGQFFGMMAEQSKTSAGLWSSLQDSVNDLFLALGTPLNDAIKPVLTDAMSLAEQLKPVVADIGTHMGEALGGMRNFIAEAKDGSGLASAMGSAISAMLNDVFSKAMVPFKAAWAGMASMGEDLKAWLAPVWDWAAARMESAAMSFGKAIMKQLAEVFAALPMGMGKAAAETLNKSATAAGQAASVANRQANKAEERIKAPTAEGVAGSFDKAAGKTRGVLSDALNKANEAAAAKEAAKKAETSGFDTEIEDFYAPKSIPKSDPFSAESKQQVQKNVRVQKSLAQQKKDTDHARAVHFKEWNKVKVDTTPLGPGNDAKGIDEAKANASSPVAKAKAAIEDSFSKAKAPSGGKMDSPPEPMQQGFTERNIDPGMTAGDDAAEGPKVRVERMMGGGDGGPLSARSTSGIRSRMMGGGNGGELTKRRATPTVPSPGTAKRQQERREAAATASRNGGGAGGSQHPLMAMIKSMEAKLNTLAVAK